MNIKNIVLNQRNFFNSNKTKDIHFKIKALKKLKNEIHNREEEIFRALYLDLGKSKEESYLSELSIVYKEIDLHIKNLKSWSKPKKVKTSIVNFLGKSFILNMPYGVVLIMSPWNYPFQLSIMPLIGAISTGNCVILKPSEYSIETSKVLESIIKSTFEEEYISVILGDIEINEQILEEKFDFIFFTGSTNVGKLVYEKAASNLTPTILELGGKSPTIVFNDANIKISARRIAWGKLLNSGQTCVAPDYILLQEDIYESFINSYIEEVKNMYGENPILNKEYPKIISRKHFDRLKTLINIQNKVDVIGGNFNEHTLKIEPTIIKNVSISNTIMKEEIFGPILPIIKFKYYEDAFKIIKNNPTPLALYVFTENENLKWKCANEISYGGFVANDTIMHLANDSLPFGGVGTSGIGNYHGKYSFDAFSKKTAFLNKSTKIDINLRYPPFLKKWKWIKRFIK